MRKKWAIGGLAFASLLAGGLLFALLLAVGAGVFVWKWRQEPPPEPPLPPGITDAEVRAAVEKVHGRVQRNPRSAEAWGEYGTVLLANLFDREADQCFVEAARLDPGDPRWPYARGQIALKRRPDEAVALLTAAAEVARDKPQYRTAFNLTLAEALLERGQVDRAAMIFEGERALDPQQERALLGLGFVALARNDDATARKMFEAVRTHPCCRKQANAQLAILARRGNDVTAAKTYEDEANTLEADPPWPDPYLDRVVTLQVGHRGAERRIALLERDRQFEEAATAYLEQAKVRRTSKALTGAAVNLARLRNYSRALELLREAVQLDPADTNSHYTLALVLFTKAEKEYVRDPSSAEAGREFREVVAEAKKTTELKPDHAQAYLFWGLALTHLGQPEDALEPLRKGLVIRPGNFDLNLGLGQALAASGDRAGAEASFNTARQLDPNDPRPAQELAKLK